MNYCVQIYLSHVQYVNCYQIYNYILIRNVNQLVRFATFDYIEYHVFDSFILYYYGLNSFGLNLLLFILVF